MTAADMEIEEESTPQDTVPSPGKTELTDTSSTSPTSAVTNVYAAKTKDSPTQSAMTDTAVVFSPELLQMYYSRLFPFELLHSWLAYDPSGRKQNAWIFQRREFSMTIEPTPGEEIYLRYQSFQNQHDLTNAILKKRPVKIDLGAVFSHPPNQNKSLQKGTLQPVQRELVFDIDLTDYDDIRHCGCTGAKICPKCWTFMNMAVEVMDCGLRQDFGFQHIAWFYSGRRGVHAWICDEHVRELPNEARGAVASYFEVELPSEINKDVSLSLPLHPSLQRAYEILEPWFISDIIPASGHGLLASEERWTKDLLDTIPEAGRNVATLLKRKWKDDASTPAEKWEQLKKHIKVFIGRSNENGSKAPKSAKNMTNQDKERLEYWPIEVVFRHTYPRLDINVSKTMNHLLKSPFCVHPKTGRVCVPIEPEKIREFDPFQVPTLAQLLTELDAYKQKEDAMEEDVKQQRTIKYDWQKTSLQEFFQPFQKQFLEPLQKEIRAKEKQQAEQEAAMRGDF